MLGIQGLDLSLISKICQDAQQISSGVFEPIKTSKPLVNLFLENSTRTRISFEKAAGLLGLKVINFDVGTSSMTKNESLIASILTINQYDPYAIVIRSPNTGESEILQKYSKMPIVNAGDGTNEHPTQALLDLYTICQKLGIDYKNLTAQSLKGLRIGISGDIAHSRVARSNIFLLSKLGAEIILISNSLFLPHHITEFYKHNFNCKYSDNLQQNIHTLDVLIMLRFQQERFTGSVRTPLLGLEFLRFKDEYFNLVKPKFILLHPGPVNESIELSTAASFGHHTSCIMTQVKNGAFVRAGVLLNLYSQA